jgi:hypothetical protein
MQFNYLHIIKTLLWFLWVISTQYFDDPFLVGEPSAEVEIVAYHLLQFFLTLRRLFRCAQPWFLSRMILTLGPPRRIVAYSTRASTRPHPPHDSRHQSREATSCGYCICSTGCKVISRRSRHINGSHGNQTILFRNSGMQKVFHLGF